LLVGSGGAGEKVRFGPERQSRSTRQTKKDVIVTMKMIPDRTTEPDVVELKFNRLIEEMRDLRRHVISVEARLRGIEEHLKPGEEQPEIKSKPWLDVASVTARTILFTVGTAVGAVLTKLYLGT
jgi:hypothetical protein